MGAVVPASNTNRRHLETTEARDGPVVLRPKGSTWRTQRAEGGGCLYDYAAHAINLVNWYFGEPSGVSGTVLNSIFSADTDDEVYSTLLYPSAQVLSARARPQEPLGLFSVNRVGGVSPVDG